MKPFVAALTVAMVAGSSLPVMAQTTGTGFDDVKATDWYYKAVRYLNDRHVVSGYEGKFRPASNITRAEFAQMLYAVQANPALPSTTSFEDVSPKDWYYKAVSYAQAQGYVSGYDQTHFAPYDLITREQAAKMIHGLFTKMNYYEWPGRIKQPMYQSPLWQTTFKAPFTDRWAVSHWAGQAVDDLRSNLVIMGYTDGTYRPQQHITRAEASELLYKVVDWIRFSWNPPPPLPPAKSVPVMPTQIYAEHAGHNLSPVLPEKGLTVTVSKDGEPMHTTQIVDLLNPTPNPFSVLEDGNEQYRVGNIPVIQVVSDNRLAMEQYHAFSQRANEAADLFSKLTFTFDTRTLKIKLPDSKGQYAWKYYDYEEFDRTVKTATTPNLETYLGGKWLEFTLHVDKDMTPDKLGEAYGWITFRNMGNDQLQIIYSTIDLN